MDRLFGRKGLAALLLILLLSGCAGTDTIRGRLNYDLRPEGARTGILWPPLPEVPRYRYVGELIGEPNFEDVSDKTLNPVVGALKWLAGVFEVQDPRLLQRPLHGTVSDKGRIYVADAGRNAVLVFDPKAPAEEKDDRGEGQLLVWQRATPRTPFEGVVAVSMAWGGDIAVSDARLGFVARLNELGEPVGKLGQGELQRPTGLAFDPQRGWLFVADTLANDIKVYDQTGRRLHTIGSAGEGAGEFNAPTHLAFAGGRLYVTDTLNNRIQIFSPEGERIGGFGERGLYVGNLTRPKGVAVGEGGIVYVVESYFAHLLAFSERHELLLGINGSGAKGGNFLLPSGVWTDKAGRIYVADMFNGRIVVFQFMGGDGG